MIFPRRLGSRVGVVLALLGSAVTAAALCIQVLDGDRTLTLELDVDLGIPSPSLAHVFWDAGRPADAAEAAVFNMQDIQPFDVRPGQAVYRIPVPLNTRALRLDPISGPGSIAFRRITILSNGLVVRRWDAERGFAGWQAESDLRGVGLADGRLRMEAVGPDPFLIARGLSSLRAERRRLHRICGAGAGLLWLALQAVLVLPATRGGPAAPAPARSETSGVPARSGRARLATAGLALVSTALSAAAAYFLYRAFVAGVGPPPPPLLAAPEYEPTLVDRSGRPLSAKPGGLKLVLDPFTLYRNFPGQRTNRFTIDAYGWRGGFDERSGRPRAVVLGGSAAFGLGLASDADTFAARLESLGGGYEVVNAGVVGFISGQELAEMTHYADRLRPRVYVVFDGWNELVQVLDFKEPGAAGSLGYNRHIFRTLEDRLRLHAAEDLPAQAPLPVGNGPGWTHEEARRRIVTEYTDNLSRMAAFARARDAELLVVLQPQLGAKRRHGGGEAAAWQSWLSSYGVAHPNFAEDYEALLDAARTFCLRQGIAYLDASRAPAIAEEARPLFLDAVHLNAEGHRVVAELVRARLDELGAR